MMKWIKLMAAIAGSIVVLAACEGEMSEENPMPGDGDAVVGDGDGDAVVGDGDGDAVVGDGDGDGDGDAVVGDGDGDGDGTAGAGGASSCEGLTESECDSKDECEGVFGITLEDMSSRYAGCRWAGAGDNYIPCNSALSCGFSPTTNTCWRFGNDCGPDGWEMLESALPEDEAPANCPSPCNPDN